MNAEIVLVVAIAENGVIGAKGKLPWRVKADLRKFRAITMGKPVIMGRKTLDEIGRVLDGRDIIVVTRQPGFTVAGASVAANLLEAIEIAGAKAAARGVDEICVAGGGEIYAQAMPLADRLHVTHIAAKPEGDVFFPEIAPADWVEVSRENLPRSDGDTATGVHVLYRRRH
jgi:dihydrofolate reductase